MKRLLIRPGAMGDCILSLPAMECLRAEYLEVWVASQNRPLIRFADSVHSIASTGIDLLGLPGVEPPSSVLDRLRRFDSVVSWYGSGRSEFRSEVAALDLPFRFLTSLPGKQQDIHAADFFLSQARALGGCEKEATPRIECLRSKEGFAVIHPYSGSKSKNWPLERYRELARRLSTRMPVKWCAGPEEQLEEAQRFEDAFDLACWLAHAAVFIGNDSGVAHLAAAVGTPVVALFGPTNPAIWAPRGDQVRVVATSRPGDSMENVALEQVTAALESIGIPPLGE